MKCPASGRVTGASRDGDDSHGFMNSLSTSRDARLDALLCTTLAEGSLPREVAPEDLDALWERARLHDVDVLIAAIVSRLAQQIPTTVHQQAASRFAEAELRDLLRYRELCRITASFAAAAVDVLLLKGAGLAYIVYPQPCVRPSRDIDLFIRRESRDAAERALAACGYTRQREPDGELARAQRHYARADGSGLHHFVDLHWRVSNTRLFADALSFDEAWSSSMVVLEIGPPARTLGVADALLLACIHRVAHHHDALDLLWLWDIHLLAGGLTAETGEAFVSRAERTQMRAVSVRGLELARDRFGTRIAADLLARLKKAGPVEPSARFIGGDLRMIDVVRADLGTTGRWRDRASLLREHLFPSRKYMRAIYTQCPSVLLPIAYVDRIVRGAPQWFRRPQS